MENKSLVVIDVQTGLFDYPGYVLYEPEKLLQNINTLIQKARDAKTPVIFVRHNDEGLPHKSSAWQIHEDLHRSDDDVYVDKKHCDSFLETNFEEVLKSRGIEQIIVCGLQTEYCVDTACRSAAGRGFKVTLVKDAHSTYDSEVISAKQIIDHHNETLGGSIVELVATDEVNL